MRTPGPLHVTRMGGAATALMVAAWVIGLAWGFFWPSSLIGAFIHAPLGLPAYVFGVAVIFAVAATVCGSAGLSFFRKGNDAA